MESLILRFSRRGWIAEFLQVWGSETVAVGVIIVTYSAEDVISRCLDSLMSSTGVDLRILVVDNASRDKTVERIRSWATGVVPVQSIDGIFRAAPPKRVKLIVRPEQHPSH